ncbi:MULTISPECIES: hypothetical protein [Kitasatospora]|uniref:Restriction endonuclease type IV Mrr domain-containing protein n=1 Tax=Kitasatospora setae (strain ATCC 33774 / DSM 43861 / JCM 3304 / KCC A-0304 / NBRC 14216 / KM-6054) TaxID=452652 RepID=E4N998_KITSK|nr:MULTISPECIES: hypothetical protein [Kitasatospora]BAJ27779.1 hypothetical protein KSE_19550 [Kitasatospora setae KM-6054]
MPLPEDAADAETTTAGPVGFSPGSPSGASQLRCPACRAEHRYEPPSLPCPCGAQLRVPLLRGGVPVQVRFRSWEDSWLSMRCPHCGRSDQWPQPEFTCDCGVIVRLPVDRAPRLQSAGPHIGPRSAARPAQTARPYTTAVPPSAPAPDPAAADGGQLAAGSGAARALRPPFRPQPVRTPQDAVLTAARYLQWLGFYDLELLPGQERDSTTLLGGRMIARVDTWTEPADVKAVECLWLETLHSEDVAAAMFTVSGYSRQTVVRGEQLLVALFTLDAAGIPQPSNGAAEALMETGWTS